MTEIRQIIADSETECFDVASVRQIADAAADGLDQSFRQTHAALRGALAEALAGFIVA
jgi:hypothetical protein